MAKNKSNQKAKSTNRMPSRATTPAAPAPVQQAPYPAAFAKNPPPAAAQYIPGLMVPGNEALGYRPEYGGGGYAAGLREFDGPNYNSVNDIKDWYKAMAFTGNKALGVNRSDIEWAARQYDAGNLGAAGQSQAATQSQAGAPTNNPDPASLYRGIKSINQGLKIQGDNILGRREARRIARGTGKSYDDVITKALGRGMSIGGGAVKRSNRAFEQSGAGMLSQATKGLSGRNDPLAQMRRATPGKGQMYSGTYELDGQTMPLIESRRGGAASTLAGGGKGKGKGKGKGRGGAGDMSGMGTQATPTPMEPMSVPQMVAESSINENMPGYDAALANWATGFRSKRSSRKRAGSMAQGLASQRVNPTGSWSYKI